MTERNEVQLGSDECQTKPCHRAEDLMGSSQTAHIKLGDQLYTLRITRAGKLILTK